MAGKKQALLKKFMAKVLVVPGGHWYWLGSKTKKGYGKIQNDGQYIGAHVAAYLLFRGLVPVGHDVHHVCKRIDCVNPEHLEALTEAAHGQEHIKSHCKHGHPLSGANVYTSPVGDRQCRTCRRIVDKRRIR